MSMLANGVASPSAAKLRILKPDDGIDYLVAVHTMLARSSAWVARVDPSHTHERHRQAR